MAEQIDKAISGGEKRMKGTVEHLEREFSGVRTGRATPALLDTIKVEYYGSPTPLKQLASVGTPEPQSIVIKPYDPGSIKEIEKAILASDIGITPHNDGKVVRLQIPPLSEERRTQLIHHAKELAEAAKQSIRNIRRDGNKALDTEKKDGDLPEDEMFRGKDEVQKLTDSYEKKVEEMLTKKSEDIMKV